MRWHRNEMHIGGPPAGYLKCRAEYLRAYKLGHGDQMYSIVGGSRQYGRTDFGVKVDVVRRYQVANAAIVREKASMSRSITEAEVAGEFCQDWTVPPNNA